MLFAPPNILRRLLTISLAIALALATARTACAQDNVPRFAPGSDESASFESEIILDQMNTPTALAVREGPVGTGPHELFIAESGAGRVIRVSTATPKNVSEAITGFSVNDYSVAPRYQIGPLSLLFLTRSKLVVGEGGNQDGKNRLYVFSLPIGGTSLTTDDVDHSLGFQTGGANEIQFLSAVKTDTTLYCIGNGLQKAEIKSNQLSNLLSLAASDQFDEEGKPLCVTHTPKTRPAFLVVGQMGSQEFANDSSITFFLPSNGQRVLNLATGLHDISGLAYSPSGNLYALDIAWNDEQAGGIYRLDDALLDGRQACRAVKIASVARPTGMAFTPDGILYVTSFGTDEGEKQGSLIKITGKF